MRAFLPILLAAFLAVGCTTVGGQFPLGRMESPEAIGIYPSGKRVHVAARYTSVVSRQFTEDASSRPPTSLNPTSLTDMPGLEGLGSYAVLNRVDIGIKSLITHSPTMIYAKYQIFGKPWAYSDEGDPRGFLLSVTAAAGYGSGKQSGSQRGTFGPGGYPWESKVTTRIMDIALIGGYRFDERFILYGGGFYAHMGVEGAINHRASDNGQSPEAQYNFGPSQGQQIGANLGGIYELGNLNSYVIAEILHAEVAFAPGITVSVNRYHGGLGFHF